jgi:hypothetical protein
VIVATGSVCAVTESLGCETARLGPDYKDGP